jgi:RNA polymerase primary sigma factor
MRDFKITERYTPKSGKAFQKYLQEIEKTRVMNSQEESQTIQKILSGDLAARQKLITSNLRFVISVAKSYTRDPEVFVELIAVGNIGLVYALDHFDHSRGFKFISYAIWHIRKEMLLFLSENSRTVRIPTNKVQQIKAVRNAQSKLAATMGRDISVEEAVEYLKSDDKRYKNLNEKSLDSVLVADNRPHSLGAAISSGDNHSTTWEDVIESQIESPEDQIMKSSRFELLMDFLHILNPVEKEIIFRYHGLNGYVSEESFESISVDLGVSNQSIQQKYQKSLRKLKVHARKNSFTRSDFW